MHPELSQTAPVDLLIMLGDVGPTFPEQIVGNVREAVALDMIEKALALDEIERIIVGTNRRTFLTKLSRLAVDVVLDYPDEAFHFGRQIKTVIEECQCDRVFYMGGGAAPLLTLDQLRALIGALSEAPNRLVTNNLYSSDMVGFSAGLLDEIDLPSRDNDLAWKLAQLGGLDVRQPPRSPGTSFDVDTITDVLILTMCPGLGEHTREVIQSLNLDTGRLRAALDCLQNPDATLLLMGRASSEVWRTLQRRAQCGVRLIVEERGMRASGRLARGEVRSLVGLYAEQFGFDALFEHLAGTADAIFMDSRILFAHFGQWPSDADRNYSDLSMPAAITDPTIRALTRSAMDAPVPIVMGGHSLIAGGMLALLDAVGL